MKTKAKYIIIQVFKNLESRVVGRPEPLVVPNSLIMSAKIRELRAATQFRLSRILIGLDGQL